jgi:uncharacterized protein YacL
MLDYLTELATHYQDYLIMASFISLFIFVASLLLTPFLLGRIPADYFINPAHHKLEINHFGHLIIMIIRNLIGFCLLLVGIVMLVTPGQGIISILLGLFLMQFPGKHKLELKIINHNPTFTTLNWLRARANKPPFRR